MNRKRLSASALFSLFTSLTALSADYRPSIRHDVTTLAAISSSSSSKKRVKRRRSPAVDSALLRFVSAQKQRMLPVSTTDGKTTLAPENVTIDVPIEPLMPPLELLPTDVNEQQQIATIETPDAVDGTVNTTASDTSVWLGQFNHHRVASVLIKYSADSDSARAAGESVQQLALARTARRKLRAFLKQRDQVWMESTAFVSSADTLSSHNVEEIVELLLEYGLTARDAAELFVHSPSIAFMRPRNSDQGDSLEETVQRSLQLLCDTLKLRKYDARKVLRNCPGLLTRRGSRSAEQLVAMLQELNVSPNAISRDKTALPVLLSRSPAAVFRLVAFLSSDAVRMPVDKIGPLLRRSDCQELLDHVAPVSMRPQESDWNVAGTMTASSSQIRRDTVEAHYRSMSTTAWTLRHEIGTADLGKVIAAYPKVLLLNAHEQILPTADYLMNELGINELARVLQLYPVLLGMSVEELKQTVDYLLSLEVSPDNLASIFRSFPVLFTLDIDSTMQPAVDFLRRDIGIANVGRFVSRLPPVLGYDVEKELKPKWEFLQTIVTDARFEVSKFPAYFSYPLDRVIKARYEYLREVKQIPTQLVALDQVLRYGDKDFAIKVAHDPSAARYLEFCQTRRQSQSQHTTARPKRPKRKSSSVP